jgi:hypothetical protein
MEQSLKYADLDSKEKEFFRVFKIEENSISKTAEILKMTEKDVQTLKNKIIPLEKEFDEKDIGSISYVLHIRNKWKSKFDIKKKGGKLHSGLEERIFPKLSEDEIVANFWEYYDWYLKTPKKCHYCSICEIDLKELYAKIYPKDDKDRIDKNPTRGRTLEIDRMEPNKPYSEIKNLVYSCYWCNNAKTDTFNEIEGKMIGDAIRQIWQKKLDKTIGPCHEDK